MLEFFIKWKLFSFINNLFEAFFHNNNKHIFFQKFRISKIKTNISCVFLYTKVMWFLMKSSIFQINLSFFEVLNQFKVSWGISSGNEYLLPSSVLFPLSPPSQEISQKYFIDFLYFFLFFFQIFCFYMKKEEKRMINGIGRVYLWHDHQWKCARLAAAGDGNKKKYKEMKV